MNITPDMIDYDNYSDKTIVTVEGKRYQVEFEPDYDGYVDDADCYSEEDIEAWRNDEWSFVAIAVTPLDVPEHVQFELSDDLCGLEFDFPLTPKQVHNGRSYTRTNEDYRLMVYPVPDMIDTVYERVIQWKSDEAINNHVYG